MSRPSLLGVAIDDLSRTELIGAIITAARERKRRRIYNVNLHALNLTYECPQFRSSLQNAHLVYNDSMGVRVAAALTRKHIKSRHTVGDWLDDLVRRASMDGVSIFLLGDQPGVAAAAAGRMVARYPSLRVAGTHHGFFHPTGCENWKVIQAINESKPDLLLVGMGMPKQEFWIDAYLEVIDAGAFVPVGAAFRWYAEVERRGPRWITDNGGEWLWRLAQHPVRLFSRYIIGNPLFALRLFEIHVLRRPLSSKCSATFTAAQHTCSATPLGPAFDKLESLSTAGPVRDGDPNP
jgi:N-acetylglucosaminyldiphosphoundecaprenol N-acetyl-beta-D-mannosaminyltransferase